MARHMGKTIDWLCSGGDTDQWVMVHQSRELQCLAHEPVGLPGGQLHKHLASREVNYYISFWPPGRPNLACSPATTAMFLVTTTASLGVIEPADSNGERFEPGSFHLEDVELITTMTASKTVERAGSFRKWSFWTCTTPTVSMPQVWEACGPRSSETTNYRSPYL